ncbi:ASTE1-like protein [Mya arenaria]|uniref:ASTE1-like protein n=1 Tax=Mya arenaria TaxID=6604 RepID=A0ABY7FC30_MYAAR|nr:ASTE1-like protein [Mya arenaria]
MGVRGEYGGDYDNYANKCKTFFTNLRACKVEPYVVLDGGYDPDKRNWNTAVQVQRKASSREPAGLICENGPEATEEHVLPFLCHETFQHVLRELQIPQVTCPYEADREIAVLANKYIRSALYGLTTSFSRPKSKDSKVKTDDLVDLQGTRKSCIEESDRQKGDRMKVYIKPTTEVSYGSQL